MSATPTTVQSPQAVGFLLFPGVVQLDVTAALQVLAFSPSLDLQLVASTMGPLRSAEGLVLQPTATFETCVPLTALVVPGGGHGQATAMADGALLAFLRRQAEQVQCLASVCTGSLLLGAAGLLRGRRATTHWAFRDQLVLLGAELAGERVVVDGNLMTAAGVTAGLDLGLRLLERLCDRETAQLANLMLEYDPELPYGSGSPAAAGPERVDRFLNLGAPLLEEFRQVVEAAAADAR